jgi:hypothetical protein
VVEIGGDRNVYRTFPGERDNRTVLLTKSALPTSHHNNVIAIGTVTFAC